MLSFVNDTEKALECLQEAQRIRPGSSQIKERLKKLEYQRKGEINTAKFEALNESSKQDENMKRNAVFGIFALVLWGPWHACGAARA